MVDTLMRSERDTIGGRGHTHTERFRSLMRVVLRGGGELGAEVPRLICGVYRLHGRRIHVATGHCYHESKSTLAN
eukprot:1196012-Prorocentrum_minimum.AAC.3